MFGKLSDGTSVRSAVLLRRQKLGRLMDNLYPPHLYKLSPLVKAHGCAPFKCPGDGYKIVRD